MELETFKPLSEIEYAEKTIVLEPVSAEVLSLVSQIENSDYKNTILRYASLYLNTLLQRLNEAEQYEMRKLEDIDMPEIEENNPEITEIIRKIEDLLNEQESQIRNQNLAA